MSYSLMSLYVELSLFRGKFDHIPLALFRGVLGIDSPLDRYIPSPRPYLRTAYWVGDIDDISFSLVPHMVGSLISVFTISVSCTFITLLPLGGSHIGGVWRSDDLCNNKGFVSH